ncbi:MAG TPA: hypothetical protein PL028_09530, partial [Bacteroidales bacterium]|nr:hypothetical protein [Bacteroidales bacterium]
MEILSNKLFGAAGLLTDKHPFHKHSEVSYFIAIRNKKIIGRIAAFINNSHINYHKEKVGFFGFFEVIDDYDIAKILLEEARKWIKDKGMEMMRGPSNFSSNETWGLLVENFYDYPMVYTPYNKKYYENFLLQFGFAQTMDLLALTMPVMDKTTEQIDRRKRIEKIAERIRKKQNITIRPLNLKKFDEELKHLSYIYEHAWGKNWGFIPLTEHEFKDIAVGMKALLKPFPGLATIAFVDGEPAGFIASLPDFYEFTRVKRNFLGNSDLIRLLRYMKKKKKHKRVRLFLFGLTEKYRKSGLDAILFLESFKFAQTKGFEECEISWLLETNKLVISHSMDMDAKVYRKW